MKRHVRYVIEFEFDTEDLTKDEMDVAVRHRLAEAFSDQFALTIGRVV